MGDQRLEPTETDVGSVLVLRLTRTDDATHLYSLPELDFVLSRREMTKLFFVDFKI